MGICNLLNAIYASGKAKVADNYFITTGEEDVLSFEVSVDDLVLVHAFRLLCIEGLYTCKNHPI